SDFASSEREIIELMARDIGNSIAAFEGQKALEQSELEFRQTFEQASVGITHVGLDGRFLKVNSTLCQFLGYSSQEMLEMTFQDITYAEDLALDEKYVPQVITGEIESCQYEKRYIHADGSVVWANLTFSLAIVKEKEPAYFIAVIEDIRDRKLAEISMLQASQAKDTFITHMSHELRTPLNSVIGFSNILKKDPDLTSKQFKSIDIINQSGQHLLTLINDILDLSKLNAKKQELLYSDLNLVNFLHDLASIFQARTLEKGIDFRFQISSDLPLIVNVDETRLRQVLFNLLSNAVKFTDSGSITLSVSSLAQTENRNKIRFEIQDTGRGIPQDKYDVVFATFGQVNQNAEGTGLGIPICQNILKLMNSQLHLDSKPGQGSLFWFDLELKEITSSLITPLGESHSQQWHVLTKPRKILVVDDNEDNRILLVEYFRPLGFIVQEADDGQTGLAIAKKFEPDVILVDLLMPVMNGKEMIEHIRQDSQLKDTVILMISANTKSIIDSSDIKCDGFLAKPLDFDKLQELLEQHLQLEWQPMKSELNAANSIILPELDELNKLLELVNSGNMDDLLAQIDLLTASNSQYLDFTQHVRQLADSCQQDRLEQLFKAFISEQ
ncbi:MAG: ATP-binding protein, partial [Cyanobacteria bacterium P01_A01_bin.83]